MRFFKLPKNPFSFNLPESRCFYNCAQFGTLLAYVSFRAHNRSRDRKEGDMNEVTYKDVFNILEGKDGKSRWVKIGSAFVNKDGSINALLDVYPRDGKLQIRDRKTSNQQSSDNH